MYSPDSPVVLAPRNGEHGQSKLARDTDVKLRMEPFFSVFSFSESSKPRHLQCPQCVTLRLRISTRQLAVLIALQVRTFGDAGQPVEGRVIECAQSVSRALPKTLTAEEYEDTLVRLPFSVCIEPLCWIHSQQAC